MIKFSIKLNEGQLDKLADFSANIGVVQFAIVVTPIFSNTGTGNSNPFMIVLGIILMFGFLLISLSLKR